MLRRRHPQFSYYNKVAATRKIFYHQGASRPASSGGPSRSASRGKEGGPPPPPEMESKVASATPMDNITTKYVLGEVSTMAFEMVFVRSWLWWKLMTALPAGLFAEVTIMHLQTSQLCIHKTNGIVFIHECRIYLHPNNNLKKAGIVWKHKCGWKVLLALAWQDIWKTNLHMIIQLLVSTVTDKGFHPLGSEPFFQRG